MMMGERGARWVRSRLVPEGLDVTLLMWDMHRTVRPEHFPAHRVVVGFEFTDVPRTSGAGGWLARGTRRTCA
jgi:hypothetical protein